MLPVPHVSSHVGQRRRYLAALLQQLLGCAHITHLDQLLVHQSQQLFLLSRSCRHALAARARVCEGEGGET